MKSTLFKVELLRDRNIFLRINREKYPYIHEYMTGSWNNNISTIQEFGEKLKWLEGGNLSGVYCGMDMLLYLNAKFV